MRNSRVKQKDLTSRLEKLEQKILDNTPSKIPGTPIVSILEKLLVPILLGIMTFYISRSQTEISENQVILQQNRNEFQDSLAKEQFLWRLTEAEINRQQTAEEANAARQLKFIELFYKEVNDQRSPERQYSALALLKIVEPSIAESLAKSVAYNGRNSLGVRREAELLIKSLDILGPLINYSIVIYFIKGNSTARKTAEFYQERMNAAGIKSVEIRGTDVSTFEKWGTPTSYEIRHDNFYEEEAAEYLLSLLTEINRNVQFEKIRTNKGSTPNVLTMFIPHNKLTTEGQQKYEAANAD